MRLAAYYRAHDKASETLRVCRKPAKVAADPGERTLPLPMHPPICPLQLIGLWFTDLRAADLNITDLLLYPYPDCCRIYTHTAGAAPF